MRKTDVDVRAGKDLVGKFDWLADADTAPLRAQLAGIFAAREIETIAPGFGRIIRGRKAVDRHVELLDRALAEANPKLRQA